jgi:Na+/H+ antiporter NhaD/arsenite permease-like protein
LSSPVLALGVFLLTYTLISLRTLGRMRLDKPSVVLLGASLMVLFGVLGPADVLRVFGPGGYLTPVLLLLLGMMLLVGGLELVGFFDLVTYFLVKRAGSPVRFLILLMVVVAVLSALVLNDTVVLLFTPIIVRACRSLQLNPVPYLVGEAVAANVGSVATQVGNPQIALIAIASGIPFAEYALLMAPIGLACLGVSIGVMVWIYGGDLRASANPGNPEAPVAPSRTVDRPSLVFLLSITSAVVLAFFLSSLFGWNLAIIAFVGGSLATFALPAFRVTSAREVLMKVDWTILLLFIGLFIILEGVTVSGLMGDIVGGFEAASGGQVKELAWLTGITALLSNLVSNVPAVALMVPVLQGPMAGLPVSKLQWLALASSSTLAGNATILGAAANLIVVQSAAGEKVEVTFREFTKAGLPITLATLVVSTAILEGYALMGVV